MLSLALLLVVLAACRTDASDSPGPSLSGPTGTPAALATRSPIASPSASALTGDALYVSRDGDDDDAGSRSQPFRTIGKALATVRAGGTVVVRGGTYREDIDQPRIEPGRPDAGVLLRNYPGERPVIEGLLRLKGADYWTIDGINVTWRRGNERRDHMVVMHDGVGWSVRNAEFWGAESFAGMLVYGSTPGEPRDWTVERTCIHDTVPSNGKNEDHNLYINTGLEAGPGVVENNVLFGAPNGTNIKVGGPDSIPADGSSNVTVRNNLLVDGKQSMLVAGGTRDTTIERNLIVDSGENWLIRGYLLVGERNVVRNNAGTGADRLIYNDPDYPGLDDGGGNVFPLDPLLSGRGCDARPAPGSPASQYGPQR